MGGKRTGTPAGHLTGCVKTRAQVPISQWAAGKDTRRTRTDAAGKALRRLQSRSQWRRRRSLHTAARPRASCKALIVLQRRSLVQPARAVRLSPRHDRKHHNTRLSAASGWCAKSRRAVSELKPIKRPLARLPSKRRGSPPQPPPPRLGRPPPLAFANPATAKVGHPRPPQAPGRRSGLALRTRS